MLTRKRRLGGIDNGMLFVRANCSEKNACDANSFL